MSRVAAFHRRFGHPAPEYPPLVPDPELVRFRARLVREEFEELLAELHALAHADDPVRIAELLGNVLKESCDLAYVAEGTAIALGLPFDRAYDEVHRSNMSKTPARDGVHEKPSKGPNYFKANMGQFVAIIESEASHDENSGNPPS
jgi:predicted HAD superfamily Cof-like phosphohydrolase